MTCSTKQWRVRQSNDVFDTSVTCSTKQWRVRHSNDVFDKEMTCSTKKWRVWKSNDMFDKEMTYLKKQWRVRHSNDVFDKAMTCSTKLLRHCCSLYRLKQLYKPSRYILSVWLTKRAAGRIPLSICSSSFHWKHIVTRFLFYLVCASYVSTFDLFNMLTSIVLVPVSRPDSKFEGACSDFEGAWTRYFRNCISGWEVNQSWSYNETMIRKWNGGTVIHWNLTVMSVKALWARIYGKALYKCSPLFR